MVPDISTGIPRAPAYSGADSIRSPLRLRGSHPLWPGIPAGSARFSLIFGVGPITPAPAWWPRRFGLFPVRSPLLGKSFLLSFPMGTKMFQFPTFPSYTLLYSCMDIQSFFTVWVPSFGHPRLDGYLLLPVAFRSLSRPSSALGT